MKDHVKEFYNFAEICISGHELIADEGGHLPKESPVKTKQATQEWDVHVVSVPYGMTTQEHFAELERQLAISKKHIESDCQKEQSEESLAAAKSAYTDALLVEMLKPQPKTG